MEKKVYVYSWVNLPSPERLLMRQLFNIPRSSGTVSIDGKLQSDGHTEQDLRVINVQSMQKFLDDVSSDDFETLYDSTLEKVRSIIVENNREEKERIDAQYEAERRAAIARTVNSLMVQVKNFSPEVQMEVLSELKKSLFPAMEVFPTQPSDEPVTQQTHAKRTKKAK